MGRASIAEKNARLTPGRSGPGDRQQHGGSCDGDLSGVRGDGVRGGGSRGQGEVAHGWSNATGAPRPHAARCSRRPRGRGGRLWRGRQAPVDGWPCRQRYGCRRRPTMPVRAARGLGGCASRAVRCGGPCPAAWGRCGPAGAQVEPLVAPARQVVFLEGRDAPVHGFEERPLGVCRGVGEYRPGRRCHVLDPRGGLIDAVGSQAEVRPAGGQQGDAGIEGGGREGSWPRKPRRVARGDRQVAPPGQPGPAPACDGERQGQGYVVVGHHEQGLVVAPEDVERPLDANGALQHCGEPPSRCGRAQHQVDRHPTTVGREPSAAGQGVRRRLASCPFSISPTSQSSVVADASSTA